MNQQYKELICVVEDNRHFAYLIKEFLEDEGFEVLCIHDGDEAVAKILECKPSAVILDVSLPGMDGVEICRKLKSGYSNPVLMLTATEDEYAEINALNFGADKFIRKPVKPQVLLAHLNSSLSNRNTEPLVDQGKRHQSRCIKGLVLDHRLMTASINGHDLGLSCSEFKLLSYLEKNNGSVKNREEIYEHLRGWEYDGVDRYVDLKICDLRRKMRRVASSGQTIKTIRKQGYALKNIAKREADRLHESPN